VADKLLIKPNTTVWSSHPEHMRLIEPLPTDVRIVEGPARATTALILAEDSESLRHILTTNKDQLAHPNVLWVSYPKANRIDINRESLWPILGEYGLRPIGQVALDEVWSAMRFRPLKAGEEPFTGGR